MGYAITSEVDTFLAQALTSARPDTTGVKIKLININNERDLNRIDNEMVEFFISTADTEIDGILSQMYKVPLRKCADGQWDLDAAINEYNQYVEISDATALQPGDEIVIRDDDTGIEEVHIVNDIVDQHTFSTMSPILTSFGTDNVRVTRLKFPPPVNIISARYAASYIYDKFFAAQNSPNVSEYGKEMRKMANGRLNDILNGKIILKCQYRIGDRFGNAFLDDSYQHRDRGYATGERNMSDPGA